VTVQTTRGTVEKPNTIVDYNKAKTLIDLSDQKKIYRTPLRKSVKWYRKVAFELLCNTAIVSAHCFNRKITNSKMSVIAFRECTAESLRDVGSTQVAVRNGNHEVVETEVRHRCNTLPKAVESMDVSMPLNTANR
jgi:hypothetical protein